MGICNVHQAKKAEFAYNPVNISSSLFLDPPLSIAPSAPMPSILNLKFKVGRLCAANLFFLNVFAHGFFSAFFRFFFVPVAVV